jgi:hypothetical protein
MYLRRACPVAARRVVAHQAARQDLYQDTVNEASHATGQYLTRSLVYVDNRGIDGAVNGLAALIGGPPGGLAGCRPASSARTPCRCSRFCPGGGRHAPGEGAW